MLEYATSLMQWAIDLVSYLADELLELASTLKRPTYTAEALNGAGGFPVGPVLAVRDCSADLTCSGKTWLSVASSHHGQCVSILLASYGPQCCSPGRGCTERLPERRF